MTVKRVLAVMAVTVAGCHSDPQSALSPTSSTPEQQCSAQNTYAALTALIAAKVIPAGFRTRDDAEGREFARALSPAGIASVLTFYDPTVEAFDPKTGKVSCSAKLAVKVPNLGSEPFSRLTIVESQPNRTVIQIRYVRQIAADTGKPLLSLAQVDDVAMVATYAAVMPLAKHSDDDPIIDDTKTAYYEPDNSSSPEPADAPKPAQDILPEATNTQ